MYMSMIDRIMEIVELCSDWAASCVLYVLMNNEIDALRKNPLWSKSILAEHGQSQYHHQDTLKMHQDNTKTKKKNANFPEPLACANKQLDKAETKLPGIVFGMSLLNSQACFASWINNVSIWPIRHPSHPNEYILLYVVKYSYQYSHMTHAIVT